MQATKEATVAGGGILSRKALVRCIREQVPEGYSSETWLLDRESSLETSSSAITLSSN
jgi:hypothetical protein